MNKLSYRVIFNKNRGMLMAVAEDVASQGKSAGSQSGSAATTTSPLMRLAYLGVAVAALFGGVSVVSAQIVADPNAGSRRPTVTSTANGIPLVNIVAPSASGLSHNQYTTFGVGSQGAILNNSSTVVSTQQAGFVAGNPNLGNGPAKIILNEVTGTGISQLNGYLEVAGQRAQVIIANPNGILVGGTNGAGFINTSRAVLTTGTPVFGGDGSLNAFRVTGGNIQIGSAGLNASNVDQLDLISRSVAVNGQLWANNLNAITGTNQVNYGDLGVTVIQGDNNKPTVSIDLAALGSMYANKIKLVGTEAGVGVASYGTMAAQSGDLNIDSSGKVTLGGSTTATGLLRVVGNDGVTNTGTTYGQQAVSIYSAGQIANSGTVASQSDVTLFGGSVASTGAVGAGVNANGQVTQGGNVNLVASGAIVATGQNTAGSNIAANGASIDLSHSQTNAAGSIGLATHSGDVNLAGSTLQATGPMNINAAGAVINDQGKINVSQLTSTSASLSNVGGTITQSGSGDASITTTGAINNNGGNLTTNAQNLTIQSASLNNAGGQINHAGSGTATIQSGAISNAQGVIGTNGQLALTAASLNNQAGRLTSGGAANVHVTGDVTNAQGVMQSGGALSLTGNNIDNSAGSITSLNADGLSISAAGQLTNGAAGAIGGNGDASISAGSLVNSGKITASNNLTSTVAGSDDNSNGLLAAGKNLNASTTSLKNVNGTIDATNVALSIAQLDNSSGKITADQLAITSTNLTNEHGQISQFGSNATTIAVAGTLDNSNGGALQTNGTDLKITAGAIQNNSGTIAHAGTGTLTINDAGALSDQNGVIGTNGQLALTANSLNNQAGSITAKNQANVHVTNDIANAQGTIQSGGALAVSGANIDNTAGNITSLNADGLTLNAAGQLTNANAGVIGGNGDVAVTAANAINSGKITATHNLTTTIANSFDNSGGRLAAGNNLTASAVSLKNANGAVDAANVALTAQQLDNSSGKITADQLSIASSNLTNEHGQIIQYGSNPTQIGVTGTLDNSNGGLIQTNSADLSLTPQVLNNNGGTIALAGSGTLTVNVGNGAGTLSNAGGTLGSNGQAAITAASIANQGGALFAQQQLGVTATQGGVDNSAGGYIGGSSLNLNAANGQINNTNGKIEGTQQAVNVSAQSLNNAGGTVQSIGAAPLNVSIAQAISNTVANGIGGFIGGSGTVNLNAGSFDNSGGTVYSKDNLALQSNSTLTNTNGVIQGAANVSTSAAGALSNANGRIEANGSTATLTVSGNGIDNSTGRIANTGTGLTQINGGSQVTNHQGTIGGNGEVDINASNLDNSQQGQIIAAGNLMLNTGGIVNNNAGALYSAQNLQLNQGGAALTNVGGTVGAAGNINLNVASIDNIFGLIGSTTGAGGDIGIATGSFTNAAGTVASGHDLSLTAPTIVGNGVVVAGHDGTINLQGDYTNTAGNVLTANNNLTLNTTGNLTNTGTLTAVNGLTLNAANVDNQSTGLINASATTIQAGNAITNTGRIYGDDIALGAQTLTNDVDPVSGQAGAIAARNSINIGAVTTVNRENAIIQSLGDMTFARSLDANHLAVGTSDSITNSSATIDAGGNLVFQTAQLNNTNAHFTTAQQVDPTQTTQVTQYAEWAAPTTWYNPNQVTWGDSGNGGIVLIIPDGNRFEQFYKKDYTQTVSNTVVTSSAPGTISSGNGMVLSGNITNDKSTIIAGGTLSGTTGNINNIGATGTTDTVDHMTAGQNYYHWVSGHPHQNYYTYDNNGAAYDVTLPSTPLALQVWSVQQNTAPNSSTNPALGQGVGSSAVPSVGGLSLAANQGTQTVSGANGHGIAAVGGIIGSGTGIGGSGHTVATTGGTAGGGTSTAGSNQTIGSAGNPLPNLALPNNHLFTIQTSPGQQYLVATDPVFTNYGSFLSSNYMLNLLGINPATTEKRLGDGFYEEKLVTDQVMQLTGKRFLGGYASNEDEFKALMDSGVASAKQFNMVPGMALSDAQMAALTSDIVWMVNQTVTLPDGTQTQVLAPVVYLARADASDLKPTGALISGQNIDLKINGTLANGGTLQASNNMIVQATDITNTGNIRNTGTDGTTVLVAQNDILNNGGSISGHRVGILAGRDVTLATDTVSASSRQGTNIGLSTVASVTADQLSISAGRDLTVQAAQINTTGDAQLSAGRDLNLTAVNTQRSYNVTYNGDNHLYENQTQVNGAAINAGGNLTMTSGRDLTTSAANVNAVGQLTAVAVRDVNLGTAQQGSSLDQAIYTTSHGFLSSSSSRIQSNASATSAIGSTLSGDSVSVQAGRDINVAGSNVIGTNDVSLNAANNVSVTASQNTSNSSFSRDEKKSGFTGGFSAGVASIGYGKSSADSQSSMETVTQQSSSIASINGNTQIQAGNKLNVVASDISAGQNLTLIGKSVDLSAAQNTSVEHGAQQSSSSGFSVGVTYNPAGAFKSAYQQSASSNPSTSLLGKATKMGDAIGDGTLAAITPIVVQAGSRSASGTQDLATSNAQVSSLTAGNNLTVLATGGSITSQGASMSAGGDALLLAQNNINLDVAHSYQTQGQTSASKGWSTDNRGSMPAGAFNSKGNGNGSTDTISGTTLSAGGKATLATTNGDITLTAANLVANNDLSINAAKNLTIQSGQNTLTNANQSNSQAVGKVVISDTERFAGYSSDKSQDNNTAVTQVASNVGSLQGNVNLTAGGAYTQTASNVLAKNDINIIGKSIDINTANNTGSSAQSSSDLKVGAFATVTSPLIDLGNNIENAKKSDGRLQALQGLAATSNAYQVASAASAVAGGVGSGELLKAEVGVGFTTANSQDRSNYSQAQGSTIQGGRNVNLTSTAGDIHATGATIAAGNTPGSTLTLDSAQNILLDAGQSTVTSSGSNHSAGVQVGVGYEVGAQTGAYAFASANVGNGNYNNTATTNSNTHLSGDTVTLKSKGDTTLQGADVNANTINADVAGKLAITSVQDTSVQHNEQSNIGGRVQVSFGTAWEASGSLSQSNANGSSQTVNQQSGLFAGNGGYHVTADSVALKGGAITSTNAANSDLTANSLTVQNITNQMNYSANTASVSGSYGGSLNQGAAPDQTSTGTPSPNVIPGVVVQNKGNATSTTYGTLTDGNINVGGQHMTSAAGLGAHTDLATANGAIAALPNLQNVMSNQQAIATAANTVISTSLQIAGDRRQGAGQQVAQAQGDVNTANANIAQAQAVLDNPSSTDAQKAQAQQNLDLATQNLNSAQQAVSNAETTAKNWGPTGDYTRALNIVTGLLTGGLAGQSVGQLAANASAPSAAQAIGDYFAQPGNANQTEQVLTHAVLGAVLAVANGSSAAVGASAGASGELAAQVLTRELYPNAYDANGNFHPEQLSADQLNNVIALSTAVGALVGGATGGSLMDASVGGNIAANAATNNHLLHQTQYDLAKTYASLVAKKLGISVDAAEGRIVAEELRNSDAQTAQAEGGIHDYQVRSILGCQLLNCSGSTTDFNYLNHGFNSQYVAANQQAYTLGIWQSTTGQTYDQLVTSNIQKDPVGATLAGAGMLGLGLATAGGIPALGGMVTGGVLGGTANASMQALFNKGQVNFLDVGMGTLTGALTFGTGLVPALLVNTGGALAGSGIKGENPNLSMGGAALGTTIGYGLGTLAEKGLNTVLNPWYRQQWQDLGYGVSTAIPKNSIPSVSGSAVGAVLQELTGNTTNTVVNKK
ncbi:Putative large exoprotein involved in heme utilization or adhesion of ShlA/HecA/FhaA family [Collimonas arenae]|uniref:Putative large exoprotein involved in heme utilization or adhesion of ShlA/HecA/FhaA family n=1 Tax=Collimonas arenae TaxID=279058 RepID=A0A0A1FBB1_9BURK|nr:hemagglutinin repeat-containing protein [Collimonas arenae]AIY40132.1 Putative large exoprotein involved in heme utilization or adhesion of ShlA/HecA/FhaA family [Collimonas arenae]